MADSKTMKLLIKRLNSNNTKDALFTIKQIRNTGNPKILPFLIELLSTNSNPDIYNAIVNLLNDLKNKNGAIEIINALKNEKFKNIHKELLIACWQSGLDYSEHLPFFVRIFISSDFELAFEAFTIIENFENKCSSEIIIPLVSDLKDNISKIEKNKEGLLVELVHILEKLMA